LLSDHGFQATDARTLMTRFQYGVRILLAALLAPLLCACFTSTGPKFPLTSAAAPFGDEARFGLYERGEDKNFARQETVVVKRRTDGAYEFVNEKGDVVPISLHDVGHGRFVGQSQSDKDPQTYTYLIFRAEGPEVLVYLPDCADQDVTLLASFGVVIGPHNECSIDRVADPAKLFAEVELGEPNSKMIRE
jgi:hypothetical protein